MNEQLNNLFNEVDRYFNDEFLFSLNQFHKNNIEYLRSYSLAYSEWRKQTSEITNVPEILTKKAALHRKLELLLQEHYDLLKVNNPLTLYSNFESFLKKNANTLVETFVAKQDQSLFNATEDDSIIVKIKRSVKSTGFSISKSFHNILNRGEGEYSWNRKLPLKGLITHYLLNNFLNEMLKEVEAFIEKTGQSFITILNEQKNVDLIYLNNYTNFSKDFKDKSFGDAFDLFNNFIAETISKLDEEFEVLTDSIRSILTKVIANSKSDYEIVGTIELPSRKYKLQKIESGFEVQKSKFNKSENNFQRYISAIFDRKEFYQDLLWFSCLLVSNSYSVNKYGDKFISENLEPVKNQIKDNINLSVKKLSDQKHISPETFEKEKEKLKTNIDQHSIPRLLHKVSSNKLNSIVKEYSNSLKKNLNEFEKEYTFVQPKNLTYRLKKDQCKTFSPKEIISPIVIQKLSDASNKISDDFNVKISKLNSTIIGLGRIVEFNLDSAKTKLAEDHSIEEAVSIAKEGLLRAINKTDDYKNEIATSLNEVYSNINSEVIEVLDDLISLSNIERLITIKIQISKEKAIQDLKENVNKYYQKLLQWFRFIKIKSTSLFNLSKEKIIGISSKVGLSDTHLELSETMADYLVRVTESLNRLPYVYRRLFSNDQLSDERLFIGRKEESERLDKAIGYWLNNQISSVMLVGEKGSGTSSLINIALKKFNLDSKVYRKEFTKSIYTEEELIETFNVLFEGNNFNSVDQIIEHLQKINEKKIIVIENLEDFFLKIVNGFTAIMKLMEIITATNQNILWITTCNIYAWQYLRRVMNINDFFIFNIKLENLKDDQVEDIILGRHNISGYDLIFIPGDDIKKQKSFIKLSQNEQQSYLKKEFFEQLNKLTANNISVALFLWLRSIISSDEEKIEVSTNLNLDFSFLKSLSDQKLFTLMAIILHDGLTAEEHCLIFNNDIKSTQLLFATLTDDGIIFKIGDHYKINFQLYKPIINLLKDKNILH